MGPETCLQGTREGVDIILVASNDDGETDSKKR